MESQEERQQLEITALKSIYDADFIESPPPKAWKGAPRLPEFVIKVSHPDPEHAEKIFFHLRTGFPKTYPAIACPTFTIQQPIRGLKPDEITKLSSAIHTESQRNRGSEMVFQIVTFAQDWITTHITTPVEVVGSLATEMNKRAFEEERAKRLRQEEEAEQEEERATQLAEELNEQLRADEYRQQLEREKFQQARGRAMSDATEMPSPDTAPLEDLSLIESFQVVEWSGVKFSRVRLFHPRQECLGTIYQAEPVVDDDHATPPLELHSITFVSQWYATTQGRKKLRHLESEIQHLTRLRHENLLAVLAVKLTTPTATTSSRLVILSEQRPSVTLQDVLEECDCLREDRVTDYLCQILTGLSAIHSDDLVHRGLSTRCIGLAPREEGGASKVVKIYKAAYYVRLLDLHRSNPFGFNMDPKIEETPIPEGWLSGDVVDSPLLYTRNRDIHAVGIILLQMLMGRDVMERFPDPQSALRNATISPKLLQQTMTMLVPSKKYPASCASLLADIAGISAEATAMRSPSIPISGSARTPGPKSPMQGGYIGSPEIDYFRPPQPKPKHSSRWREDWEELELLGRGAFGSVVKARNKIDARIYAVKKIRLRATQSDSKIFREVNALSRLNHRFIVRYYTTWVETSEAASTTASSDSDSETADGMTSVPHSKSKSPEGSPDPFMIDLDDLGSGSRHSFPSIHFTRSSSPNISEGLTDSSDEIEDDPYRKAGNGNGNGNDFTAPVTLSKLLVRPFSRTLYIQMEFVERQTLKERIAEGITEEEAWRLFQQIVDALVHMSSLSILHRDIKLTNIFIDGNGDCKVGDFGLATSSLAAVDPSDLTKTITYDAEMTLDVGTRLYIAPEVQARGGPRNHQKADMYSLGVVFFEMNYLFSTAAERIAVLEGLRKPEIFFPADWKPHRTRQRQIIAWLLKHDPNERPTALELSQSSLLPPRMEDEYFRGALRMITKQDSPHYQAVLSTLFGQPPNTVRALRYDHDPELPEQEHRTLYGLVTERLGDIFHVHGAVSMDPPLLLPVMDQEEDRERAAFIDRHGEVVVLHDNALIPFARLAARDKLRRIKRYHIGDIYRPDLVGGHPKAFKAAVFDIITPDLLTGPLAAAAEGISIANDCLSSFANLAQHYEIHVSHSKILDTTMERIAPDLRATVIDILKQNRSSQSQKRSMLLRKGIARNLVDELEVLAEIDTDIDALVARLDKVSPVLSSLLSYPIKEVKSTIELAGVSGVTRTMLFNPLMVSNRSPFFKDGICFEVVRRVKRSDVLATGGRYDHLISKFTAPTTKPKGEVTCAFAVQISLEKITQALAAFQSASQKILLKEQRSFGFWIPRRCDVYVVSYQSGYLADRLEVVSLLWQNNISADVMYDSGLPEHEHETPVEACAREGIPFVVYPRPKSARREQLAFKVKSVLRGTEEEVSRQDLVPYLQHRIAEQRRVDASVSGSPMFAEGSSIVKETSSTSDVQVLLPGETKKQRKQTKQMFLDRAFDASMQIKHAAASGMPTLGIDVPCAVFDAMSKNVGWLTDEDAWKPIMALFPPQHAAYAHQVRDAVLRRKTDGHKFLLLLLVREERVFLLTLS